VADETEQPQHHQDSDDGAQHDRSSVDPASRFPRKVNKADQQIELSLDVFSGDYRPESALPGLSLMKTECLLFLSQDFPGFSGISVKSTVTRSSGEARVS
jgi:hypothetical protein